MRGRLLEILRRAEQCDTKAEDECLALMHSNDNISERDLGYYYGVCCINVRDVAGDPKQDLLLMCCEKRFVRLLHKLIQTLKFTPATWMHYPDSYKRACKAYSFLDYICDMECKLPSDRLLKQYFNDAMMTHNMRMPIKEGWYKDAEEYKHVLNYKDFLLEKKSTCEFFDSVFMADDPVHNTECECKSCQHAVTITSELLTDEFLDSAIDETTTSEMNEPEMHTKLIRERLLEPWALSMSSGIDNTKQRLILENVTEVDACYMFSMPKIEDETKRRKYAALVKTMLSFKYDYNKTVLRNAKRLNEEMYAIVASDDNIRSAPAHLIVNASTEDFVCGCN